MSINITAQDRTLFLMSHKLGRWEDEYPQDLIIKGPNGECCFTAWKGNQQGTISWTVHRVVNKHSKEGVKVNTREEAIDWCVEMWKKHRE